MFSWWCVWVSVRIRFGGNSFNIMMQQFYFLFAPALLHKVDLVILWMKR